MAAPTNPDPWPGYKNSIRCPSCGGFTSVIDDGGNGLIRLWCSNEDKPRTIHQSKLNGK